MKRREVISSAVATGTVAIAGCSSVIGSQAGPDEVTEAFFEALDADEFDTARGLVHEQTPDEDAQRLLDGEERFIQQLTESEYTVEQAKLVEEEDDEAIVEIDVTQTTDNETQTLRSRFALRTVDDEWKLYDQLETTEIE